MVRPLLVGVQLPEVEYEVGWPELISMARTAEAVGFDSIWLGDHLLYDLEAGPRGPWEVWTSLSVLAAVTSQVQLGPLVAIFSAESRIPTADRTLHATTEDFVKGDRPLYHDLRNRCGAWDVGAMA
jgi:hypothetical protein